MPHQPEMPAYKRMQTGPENFGAPADGAALDKFLHENHYFPNFREYVKENCQEMYGQIFYLKYEEDAVILEPKKK